MKGENKQDEKDNKLSSYENRINKRKQILSKISEIALD